MSRRLLLARQVRIESTESPKSQRSVLNLPSGMEFDGSSRCLTRLTRAGMGCKKRPSQSCCRLRTVLRCVVLPQPIKMCEPTQQRLKCRSGCHFHWCNSQSFSRKMSEAESTPQATVEVRVAEQLAGEEDEGDFQVLDKQDSQQIQPETTEIAPSSKDTAGQQQRKAFGVRNFLGKMQSVGAVALQGVKNVGSQRYGIMYMLLDHFLGRFALIRSCVKKLVSLGSSFMDLRKFILAYACVIWS